MGKKLDLAGRVFGYLTVTTENKTLAPGKIKWKCLCKCGSEVYVATYDLTSGHTKSCGCFHKERARAANITHGCAKIGKVTEEYRAWQHMIKRCTDKNQSNYQYYGGRGITFCERWRSFENFLEDMGNKPDSSYSLDRLDVNGNYEPANCIWATKLQQANNKRNSSFLTHGGITLTVAEWARKLNVSASTLNARKAAGWDDSRIIETPVDSRRGPRSKEIK